MNAKYDAAKKTINLSFAYDPKADYPMSKSGKNALVATSGGFTIRVEGTPVTISLNAMQPKAGE